MRSLLFMLVACGGAPAPVTTASNQAPASSQPIDAPEATRPSCDRSTSACTLETFTFFADQACACKDAACADRVAKKATEWIDTLDSTRKNSDLDEAGQRTLTEVIARYSQCLSTLVPMTDPCGGNPCGD